MYENAVYWSSYLYDEKDAYYSRVMRKYCGPEGPDGTRTDGTRVLYIKKSTNDDV